MENVDKEKKFIALQLEQLRLFRQTQIARPIEMVDKCTGTDLSFGINDNVDVVMKSRKIKRSCLSSWETKLLKQTLEEEFGRKAKKGYYLQKRKEVVYEVKKPTKKEYGLRTLSEEEDEDEDQPRKKRSKRSQDSDSEESISFSVLSEKPETDSVSPSEKVILQNDIMSVTSSIGLSPSVLSLLNKSVTSFRSRRVKYTRV